MKTRMMSLLAICVLGTFAVFAQADKKERFKVAGNCGMCETRIEKAANGLEGVTSAAWDKETKMIEVSFNPDQTSKDEIQKAIAKAGHDTPNHKATEEVYDSLPGCCKYERME
jgi:copper chaperone CopZ